MHQLTLKLSTSSSSPLHHKPSYAAVGDLFHFVTLLNVIIYAVSVLTFTHPHYERYNIFDELWKTQGFCVMNLEKPFFNSHDLCLYADAVAAIILGALYWALKDTCTPSMKMINPMMKWQSLSVLTHGIAHGMISYRLRKGRLSGPSADADLSSSTPWSSQLLIGLIFWFPMIRSFMDKHSPVAIFIISTVITLFSILFVPDLFGFMYVQTVIAIIFAYQQLTLNSTVKENFAYMAVAFVTLLLSIIPWFESTACSEWFIDYGGHVIYDAAIPIFLGAVYVISWWKERDASTTDEKTKKLA